MRLDQHYQHQWLCSIHYIGASHSSACVKMVLNAAARLVVGAGTYQHITPVPRDVLYWYYVSVYCLKWPLLPLTVSMSLAMPTSKTYARSLTSLVRYISIRLNVVAYAGSLDHSISSQTRCPELAQLPLVDSELCWRPTASRWCRHSSGNTMTKTVDTSILALTFQLNFRPIEPKPLDVEPLRRNRHRTGWNDAQRAFVI